MGSNYFKRSKAVMYSGGGGEWEEEEGETRGQELRDEVKATLINFCQLFLLSSLSRDRPSEDN